MYQKLQDYQPALEFEGTQTPLIFISFSPHLQCSEAPDSVGILKEVPLQAQVRFCLESLTPAPSNWGRGRHSWVQAPLPLVQRECAEKETMQKNTDQERLSWNRKLQTNTEHFRSGKNKLKNQKNKFSEPWMSSQFLNKIWTWQVGLSWWHLTCYGLWKCTRVTITVEVNFYHTKTHK